jgi:hypothetical protein
MEESLQESGKTLASDSVHTVSEIAGPRFNSFEKWILRKVRSLLFGLCDTYFWFYSSGKIGGRPKLPCITVVIPVAEPSEKLRHTIQSLLAARYNWLCIIVVWLEAREKLLEEKLAHPNIRFYTVKPGINKSAALREVLHHTETTPVLAWLEPGDTLTGNTLEEVGKCFKRSPKLAGVLVPEKRFSPEQSASMSADFSFLWTQSFCFSVKLFARREYLWGASQTFVGTDYDFNDWAVALNSSRTSKIKMLSNGFWAAASDRRGSTSAEYDHIKRKISATMWSTERLRRSVIQKLVRLLTPLFRLSSMTRNRASPFNSVCRSIEYRGDNSVPSVLTEGLLGFSSGMESEFHGCYEWRFPGRAPIARKVFCHRRTGTLIFEPITIPDFEQIRSGTLKNRVEPLQDRSASLRAKGVANVQAALPEVLKAQLGKKVRIARLAVSPQNSSVVALAGLDHQIESNQLNTATYSSKESDRVNAQIVGPESLFDILVLGESLDTVQTPLALLRKAANYLRQDGWLILGSTTYATDRLADWRQTIPVWSSDSKFIFSQGALTDISRVAGFETRRLIGLSAKQLECLGMKAAEALDWVHTVVPTLFHNGENCVSKEQYVLLACQRKF